MSIPPQWAKVHDRARRALVRSERLLAADMRRAVAAAVAAHAAKEDVDRNRATAAVVAALLLALPPVILRGRHVARAASASALAAELRLAARLGASGLPELLPASAAVEDVARAMRAARGYVAAWLKESVDDPSADSTDIRKSVNHRIATIAATEVSTAFEAERTRQESFLVSVARGAPWAGLLFKVWDATLDSRACSVCSGADGEIVPIGLSFSAGSPGDVHPNCRCRSATLMLHRKTREVN